MAEALELLHTPLGIAGSGRVRYGAAMELYRRAEITEAQLEAYREAAAHDGRDPAPMLAERGLPSVPANPAAAPALLALLQAARGYLLPMSHDGATEVRDGLTRGEDDPKAVAPRVSPVVHRWLSPALQMLAAERPQLAAAIVQAVPHLAWITYDSYPRAAIGESFAAGHAFAPVMGEGAPFAAHDFEMGLFLLAPGVLYRDRCHAAPELYVPLTGPHGWRFAPNAAVMPKPAHEPVWNPPFRPHLTKVGPAPFLCFYVWTRDVNEPARVLPADDWPQLEASELAEVKQQ